MILLESFPTQSQDTLFSMLLSSLCALTSDRLIGIIFWTIFNSRLLSLQSFLVWYYIRYRLYVAQHWLIQFSHMFLPKSDFYGMWYLSKTNYIINRTPDFFLILLCWIGFNLFLALPKMFFNIYRDAKQLPIFCSLQIGAFGLFPYRIVVSAADLVPSLG